VLKKIGKFIKKLYDCFDEVEIRSISQKELHGLFEASDFVKEFDSFSSVWGYGDVYGALQYGQVVAYISVIPCGEIVSLWVEPNYRDRGIANILLDKYSRDCTEVLVFHDNHKAIHLYKKFGFTTEAGDRKLMTLRKPYASLR